MWCAELYGTGWKTEGKERHTTTTTTTTTVYVSVEQSSALRIIVLLWLSLIAERKGERSCTATMSNRSFPLIDDGER